MPSKSNSFEPGNTYVQLERSQRRFLKRTGNAKNEIIIRRNRFEKNFGTKTFPHSLDIDRRGNLPDLFGSGIVAAGSFVGRLGRCRRSMRTAKARVVEVEVVL